MREASLAEKKARARKDLSIYLRFQSVEEAVSTL
ncbi:conjugal transfer fertility inhibition protein FinO, partial [Salmonella enterica subsp. enterica serovar Enteritidis str. 638970-15]